MKPTKKLYVTFLFWGFIPFLSVATPNQVYTFTDSESGHYFGKFLFLSESQKDTLAFSDIKNFSFMPSSAEVPNLGIGKTAWIRFSVRNKSSSDKILLFLENPDLDYVEFYQKNNLGEWVVSTTGDKFPFDYRKYKNHNYVFDLNIKRGEVQDYFLKIKSDQQVMVPIFITSPEEIHQIFLKKDLWFGIFCGALAIMIIYNIFLYLSIKDKVYLYYIGYILLIGLTQASILGYIFRFLISDFPDLSNKLTVILVNLAGIAAIFFFNSFLPALKEIKFYKLFFKLFFPLFFVSIIFTLAGNETMGFILVNIASLSFSLFYIAIFGVLLRRRNRQAKLLFWGWLMALTGFSVYVLRNMGILPYNFFANSTMQVGVVIESVVFSFALADRINILKKENDEKQQEIIKHLKENEKYILAVKKSELIVEKLKKESLLSQFESLKNQVNPHFLFNSLNVLLELIHQNQSKAIKFVEELSDVYRYVLDCRTKEVASLKEELNFIEAFCYLLKIRYPDNLFFKISVEPLTSVGLPPLALQLLIENAIKHNVVSQASPLNVDILQEGDFIVVRNNIQKKSGVLKPSGIGLSNLSSRYKYLSEKGIMITQTELIFEVTIPLLKLH